MKPSSDFPITPSSPGVSPEGLADEAADPWIPSEDDKSPTVTIEVSEEPSYIESLVIPTEKTSGVTTVNVVVKDKDGNPVVSGKLVIS